MNKARDEFYRYKDQADKYFGGLQSSIMDYITELERENNTLKLEQGQCFLCTAGHKEEVYELKQQNKQMLEFITQLRPVKYFDDYKS